jgi:transposase
MLTNRRTKVFVCKEYIDMRASYDSLCCKVKDLLKGDPFSGHYFLFINKKRDSLKCLFYDGSGLIVICKRLEKGRFCRINPLFTPEIVMTPSEFNLYFEGADLNKRFIDTTSEFKRSSYKNVD